MYVNTLLTKQGLRTRVKHSNGIAYGLSFQIRADRERVAISHLSRNPAYERHRLGPHRISPPARNLLHQVPWSREYWLSHSSTRDAIRSHAFWRNQTAWCEGCDSWTTQHQPSGSNDLLEFKTFHQGAKPLGRSEKLNAQSICPN